MTSLTRILTNQNPHMHQSLYFSNCPESFVWWQHFLMHHPASVLLMRFMYTYVASMPNGPAHYKLAPNILEWSSAAQSWFLVPAWESNTKLSCVQANHTRACLNIHGIFFNAPLYCIAPNAPSMIAVQCSSVGRWRTISQVGHQD